MAQSLAPPDGVQQVLTCAGVSVIRDKLIVLYGFIRDLDVVHLGDGLLHHGVENWLVGVTHGVEDNFGLFSLFKLGLEGLASDAFLVFFHDAFDLFEFLDLW